jgi:hypothetical protein
VSADEIDFDDETVRQIAATELAASISAKQVLLEEHSASFRWLMASMLAINGGGLLALNDSAAIGVYWKAAATFSFYVGILAALAIAWLGQIATRRMLVPLAELIGFWSLVSSTSYFDQTDHAAIIKKVEASMKASYFSRWAGWLSVLAFSAGLATSVFGGLTVSGEVSALERPEVSDKRVLPTSKINDR